MAMLVRWAPPGSSLWTLKLERVCMPESEWWSLRPLPLTPGAWRWGGGGGEKATLAVQVYLVPSDPHPLGIKLTFLSRVKFLKQSDNIDMCLSKLAIRFFPPLK